MAHSESIVIISSSPEYPSISDLLPRPHKKVALRSGSNAAPIPENAPKTFATAASIWRESELEEAGEGNAASGTGTMAPIISDVFTATKPSAEVAVESAATEVGAAAVAPTRRRKKSEKTSSRNLTEEIVSDKAATDILPSKKPARKPKSTKDTAMAQTTLPKARVTKPASNGKSRTKSGTVSRHFATEPPAPEPAPKNVANPVDNERVALQPAMARRLDWTPPRESVNMHHTASSAVKETFSSSGAVAEGSEPPRKDVFQSLLDTYGRKEDAVTGPGVGDAVSTSENLDVLGKRKLIEMVGTAGSRSKTPEALPSKPRATKKKPRTITELATAAYRPLEENDVSRDGLNQDSALGYAETNRGQRVGDSKTLGAKAKASKRVVKQKPSKKKAEARKPVLLSPTSAMQQVAKQDFVFGTASQLAVEDDPDLLRALHQAMKESNQEDDDPFADSSPLNSNLTLQKRLGTRLWTAGARNDGGDLLDLEVLDLTDSPPLPGNCMLPDISRERYRVMSQQAPNGEICIEIQSSDDTSSLTESLAPRQTNENVARIESSAPRNHDRDRLPTLAMEQKFEPPPSNQEHHRLLLSQSSSPPKALPEVPPRPNYELYTDAQLAREVATYGFKVVKKRTALIALLNQCWESKSAARLGNDRETHAPMSTSSTKQAASPTRPRGRPRKISPAPDTTAKLPVLAGKRGKTRSTSPTDTEIEVPQVEKRPRGRPRKGATAPPSKTSKSVPKRARSKSPPTSAATEPATPRRRKVFPKSVVEIADSESDDPFASSPESPPDQQDVFSSPPQMDLSVTEDTEMSLVASPTSQQVVLFRYITRAVISAPPSKDPMDPSWHEKMLMYDPIILEDLAAWLNSGQLDRVGYDGEVSPGDVKKWCESKSVCCLWRVNLNGKERKRF
ncbi:Structure-specific endonuclease subunit SLX4 [Madurella mycetomatis]|uniref:Structure-specific endonuclease subunit SLX4 n=1 Tax=Madurella mycetomatis TaxID=100816 RepID=A0A175WA65_9PEZI|nr:Structure-specific endonuclease subunit SLX4 [Madurella mycetomatis]